MRKNKNYTAVLLSVTNSALLFLRRGCPASRLVVLCCFTKAVRKRSRYLAGLRCVHEPHVNVTIFVFALELAKGKRIGNVQTNRTLALHNLFLHRHIHGVQRVNHRQLVDALVAIEAA